MHIGMIGGIGPAATEFYYRNLVKIFQDSGHRLELTIVHADIGELVANFSSGSPDAQSAIYLQLARRLQNAGADAIVISSIAGHFCMPQFEPVSPLPVISILPALDTELRSRKLDRVGLLGTRVTMESRLFGGISGAQIILPRADELDRVNAAYMEMAVSGNATQAQRELMFEVGRKLCEDQGADAVVLAGTDLFLVFDGQDCGFDVIDGALVHIDAIFRAATRERHQGAGS